jgi:hypothetical protein
VPVPFVIIDGYNLMHALGMTRSRYRPGEFHRCRQQMLRYLADHLTLAERSRATIVFDAKDAPPNRPDHATFEELTVQFSRETGDADALIEEMIAAHSAPKQILIVSSDHRLQKAIRLRRGRSIDSDQFETKLNARGLLGLQEIEDANQPVTPDPKVTGQSSAEDVEEWLSVFGDIPEAKGVDDELASWQKRVDELTEDDIDDTDRRWRE